MRLSPLVLRDGDRDVLASRVRSRTLPARDQQRARIVLLAADGVANRVIADKVGMHYNQVGLWRKRYGELGLAGLADEARPGRPLVYDHDADGHHSTCQLPHGDTFSPASLRSVRMAALSDQGRRSRRGESTTLVRCGPLPLPPATPSAASRTNASDIHAFSPSAAHAHTVGIENVTSGPARRRLPRWMLRGVGVVGVAEAPRGREAGVGVIIGKVVNGPVRESPQASEGDGRRQADPDPDPGPLGFPARLAAPGQVTGPDLS